MTDKLDIVLYPDEGLRDLCTPVDGMNDDYDRLIDDMFYTMYDAPGIGLAAPQVAIQKRLIVLDVSENQDQPIALINPEVVQSKGEIVYEEGCLSLPGVYAKVKRPSEILVRGLNRDGEAVELEAKDLLAICIQHEIDHLNGTLFVDHLSQLKRSRALQKYRKEMANLKATSS
ncbi:peptide deformylase [Thiomicrospira sp. WB1]|uniref:peptide deformylase n=1 Tax=Thiomicrospira sp. WB1 TaxID=1685380 RepID=UPI00074A0CC7|nr:peptide deformylase [Thiomicrospira sp. WB1]KUJ71198.1 peptide deformylase [Thiomicrospira sp. WB1]